MKTTPQSGRIPTAVLFLLFSAVQPATAETQRYETYLGNRHQFTIEIPDGWHVVDQSPYSETGVIGFYSQPVSVRLDKDPVISRQQEQEFARLLEDLSTGALPAFFVDRYKASRGMSCDHFDSRAQKRKVKIYSKAYALGKKPKLLGKPEIVPVELGGCRGLRVSLSALNADGETLHMLVYTAAINGLTYDFALLTEASYFDQNLPWFSRIMSSVRLTGAGPAQHQ